MSTRIWYLPINDFNAFISELENDVNAEKFDIKIIDQPTIVYIEPKFMSVFHHLSMIL